VVPPIITIVGVARIVVLPASAALPDAAIKILIAPILVSTIAVNAAAAIVLKSAVSALVLTGFVSSLRQCRDTRKQKRNDEGDCFALQHSSSFRPRPALSRGNTVEH
jgi:hypothetical protein